MNLQTVGVTAVFAKAYYPIPSENLFEPGSVTLKQAPAPTLEAPEMLMLSCP
ncbi:MAG: hypothetical protein VKJ46_09510 [Leptolyngbyaceae bacterium]|nr:hypothetical protein [Leptolyngbyaceae bacterium]